MDIQEHKIITGRFSDGSDREEKTLYIVTLESDSKVYRKVFEICPENEAALDLSEFEDVTPVDLIGDTIKLKEQFELLASAFDEFLMTMI